MRWILKTPTTEALNQKLEYPKFLSVYVDDSGTVIDFNPITLLIQLFQVFLIYLAIWLIATGTAFRLVQIFPMFGAKNADYVFKILLWGGWIGVPIIQAIKEMKHYKKMVK